MTEERDPVRWLSPGGDCDPALRRALETARHSLPRGARAEALARSVEQAVRERAAIGGGSRWLRRGPWLASVGVAGVALWLFAGQRPGIPAAAEPGAGKSAAVTAPEPAVETGPALERPGERGRSSEKPRSATQRAPGLVPALHRGEAEPASAVERRRGASAQSRGDEPASAYVPRAARDQGASARAAQPGGDASAAGTARDQGASARAAPGGDASAALAAGDPGAGAAAPQRAGAVMPAAPRAQGVGAATSQRSPGEAASDSDGSAAPAQTPLPPELQLLSAAQRALRASASEALALAERHARAYPRGQFVQEREEIAIAALFALGRQEQGRARARAFIAEHPRSLAARRVTQLLEGAP